MAHACHPSTREAEAETKEQGQPWRHRTSEAWATWALWELTLRKRKKGKKNGKQNQWKHLDSSWVEVGSIQSIRETQLRTHFLVTRLSPIAFSSYLHKVNLWLHLYIVGTDAHCSYTIGIHKAGITGTTVHLPCIMMSSTRGITVVVTYWAFSMCWTQN